MPKLLIATLVVQIVATSAVGVTLTISPDRASYQVGEAITLSASGDSEGAVTSSIFGQILFDAGLASYVGSTQEHFNLRFFGLSDARAAAPGLATATHASTVSLLQQRIE